MSSTASWRTAERTGALGHMDYAEVQKYSKLYDFQDLFIAAAAQRPVAADAWPSVDLQADFDPDQPEPEGPGDFPERVMQLGRLDGDQEDFAQAAR